MKMIRAISERVLMGTDDAADDALYAETPARWKPSPAELAQLDVCTLGSEGYADPVRDETVLELVFCLGCIRAGITLSGLHQATMSRLYWLADFVSADEGRTTTPGHNGDLENVGISMAYIALLTCHVELSPSYFCRA